MKYSEAGIGRVFVIRLEDGEILDKTLEEFASEHGVTAAALIVLGGADAGSRLVVGPKNGSRGPVVPMEYLLDKVHEVTGTGTLFPDDEGNPTLHMHVALGRSNSSVTGCIRNGVKIWKVAEIVLFELLDSKATRRFESESGLKVLNP